ncbi:hypothetical protein Mal15_07590 [Stieleria maiorica]|uniref:Uncharacterized protein n=1 Tax=Stieleria maiorica TaxID=2795974 RepID=A0A5B9M6F7_9BACT|nr:hypothetical protein Mal15_07590 [Stieleria maiorica]
MTRWTEPLSERFPDRHGLAGQHHVGVATLDASMEKAGEPPSGEGSYG